MNKLPRFLLPLLVLLISAAIAWLAIINRPEPERKRPVVETVSVEVIPLQRQDFPIRITSQGTTRPHTETTLIAQVSGTVVEVSPRFNPGSFFKAGDLLLKIDPRDYRAAITIAESNLAQARLRLAQEQARAEQARRDWERLGEPGEPNQLALRKPQLQSEQAAVAAAEAQLEQARLNLQRTRIRAPYAGRLLEKQADLGQFLNPGTVVGKIYAVDFIEVRLPLSNRQLEFVTIPELYQEQKKPSSTGPAATIRATIGGRHYAWPARIVRSEGAIDQRSQQTFVIARVDDPYARRKPGQPPLKIGQFVEADIEGRTLERVFVVPDSALHSGNTIFTVDGNDRLQQHEVEIIWRDGRQTVIEGDLQAGARLVVSPVSSSLIGRRVESSHRTGEHH